MDPRHASSSDAFCSDDRAVAMLIPEFANPRAVGARLCPRSWNGHTPGLGYRAGDQTFKRHQASTLRTSSSTNMSPRLAKCAHIDAEISDASTELETVWRTPTVISCQVVSSPRPCPILRGTGCPVRPTLSALRTSVFGSRDCPFADLLPLVVSIFLCRTKRLG